MDGLHQQNKIMSEDLKIISDSMQVVAEDVPLHRKGHMHHVYL